MPVLILPLHLSKDLCFFIDGKMFVNICICVLPIEGNLSVSSRITKGLIGPGLFLSSKGEHHLFYPQRPVWVSMFPCLPLCRVTRNFPMAITNQIPKKLAIEPMPKARQISSEDSFQWQAEAVVWLYSKHQRSLFTVKPGLNSFHSRCRASFDIHSDAKENKTLGKVSKPRNPFSGKHFRHIISLSGHCFDHSCNSIWFFMFWYMLWWATLHSPLLHFDKRQARTRQRNPSKKRCKNGVHGLSLTIFTSSHGICNANLQTWDILGFRTFDAKALAPVAKDCARQGPTAQSLQAPCKTTRKNR